MEKENGKWFTVKMTEEESKAIEGIQKSLFDFGMKQPLTSIIRRLMSIGSDNLDLNEVVSNPMLLWVDQRV